MPGPQLPAAFAGDQLAGRAGPAGAQLPVGALRPRSRAGGEEEEEEEAGRGSLWGRGGPLCPPHGSPAPPCRGAPAKMPRRAARQRLPSGLGASSGRRDGLPLRAGVSGRRRAAAGDPGALLRQPGQLPGARTADGAPAAPRGHPAGPGRHVRGDGERGGRVHAPSPGWAEKAAASEHAQSGRRGRRSELNGSEGDSPKPLPPGSEIDCLSPWKLRYCGCSLSHLPFKPSQARQLFFYTRFPNLQVFL